jgi:hypothetical protein
MVADPPAQKAEVPVIEYAGRPLTAIVLLLLLVHPLLSVMVAV